MSPPLRQSVQHLFLRKDQIRGLPLEDDVSAEACGDYDWIELGQVSRV